MGTLVDETNHKYILQWFYKDENESKEEASNINLPIDQYGNRFKIIQKMGYDGKGPIKKWKEGIVEPIQPTFSNIRENIGLGYKEEIKEEANHNIYDQIFQITS